MIILPYKDLTQRFADVKEVVFREGVMVYPTDTLYGLGGDFFSVGAHLAVDRIKGRTDMPYSAAVCDLDMLKRLTADIPDIFFELYEKQLPGKYTFLFHVAPTIDPVLLKGNKKIGIRIPDVPEILNLIRRLDTPLITTSVNRSGDPSLNHPDDILRMFPNIPLLIDNGPLPPSRGSTIIDLTTTPQKVLRIGDPVNPQGTMV